MSSDIAVEEVGFLDLGALHAPIRQQLDDVWDHVVENSTFVVGHQVEGFERRWAAYCARDTCIGVASGTDAIELVLAALGVGAGDEIVVPANTFIATAEAVATTGATPIFVDVDPDTLLLTPTGLEAAITRRTRAVLVVHLYGQIPDMKRITAVADRAGVKVIEDATQAHGARFDGLPAGSFGIAATFSFSSEKNLGALGDGGAVVTDHGPLAETIRSLADHRRGGHHLHKHPSRNSRLDELQAGLLGVKLAALDYWNHRRRAVHRRYLERFEGTTVETLATLPGSEPVHHLEVIRIEERDRLRARLDEHGIATGIHYARPCHKHPAFAGCSVEPLPVAEEAAARQLSLPMHPTLTDREVDLVADLVLSLR